MNPSKFSPLDNVTLAEADEIIRMLDEKLAMKREELRKAQETCSKSKVKFRKAAKGLWVSKAKWGLPRGAGRRRPRCSWTIRSPLPRSGPM
jgi:hypothetical protein